MTSSPGPQRGLALVGYRGTGKSTVGQLVADRLGWEYVDADLELEARAGRSIRSIFEEDGETAFRDLEELVLADLAATGRVVLATGGGAVIRAANRECLRHFGTVVWLTASPRVLAGRLSANPVAVAVRPALTYAGTLDEIEQVLAHRTALYRDAADAEVCTEGKTPEEVAAAVLKAARLI